MPDCDDRPRIIIDSAVDPAIVTGQCDACPAAAEIVRPRQRISFSKTSRFVLLPLQTVRLDQEYSAVFASHLNRNPIVLNRRALALIHQFQVPQCLDEILPKWIEMWGADLVHETLVQIVELGLLVPEEVVHSSED